jgi:hypothetical protein
MKKRYILIMAAILLCSIMSGVAIWGGMKFLGHYKGLLHRVSTLEVSERFSGRSLVRDSLRHQLTAPKAKFLQPERTHTLPLNGRWRQIGGVPGNGGWDAGKFVKTKALENHEGKLCTGLLGDSLGDADVWCLDGDKWSQVGGDGIQGSWSNKQYVTFLYSHQSALYAGVDREVWRLANSKWQKISTVELPGKGCTAYSATAVSDIVYFGVTNCGLRVYQYDKSGFSQTKLGLGDDVLAQYGDVYELHNWNDRLIIGATARFGTAGLYAYRPDGGISKIGGDGVNGSWINAGFTFPESLSTHRGNLIATFERTPMVHSPITAVWSFDGTNWAPLGTKKMPSMWFKMMNFNASNSINGTLLVAGGGLPNGFASIWHMDSEGIFHQLGGHGIAESWGAKDGVISPTSTAEYIYRIEEWDGKVVVGFGDDPGLAQLWLYDPTASAK